jgi:hypothetical protein
MAAPTYHVGAAIFLATLRWLTVGIARDERVQCRSTATGLCQTQQVDFYVLAWPVMAAPKSFRIIYPSH